MPFEDGIKTVSGSVANFTDGAAKVGCESVVATITASLSGTNTAKVTHIPSNNMLCLPTADVTINSMRFYTVNGVMYLNGTQTSAISSLAEEFKAFDFWLPKGTYYFQRGAIAIPTYIRTYDDGAEFQVNNGTFTITEPKHLYVSFYMANKSYTNAKADLCIKIGSTSFQATDYEDTAPKREYTANLGRTVNYATVDVVKGTGKDYSKTVQLDSFTWDYVTDEYTYGYFVRSGNVTDMTTNKNFQATGYVNNGNPRNLLADGEIGVYNNGNAIRRPVIRDDSCTSLQQFLAKIDDYKFVYECTGTPTDFTFTGQTIESEFGGNTMWNDGGGDTSVSYHDNTHGFCTVNVNRLQSKNLFDKNHANVVTGYINTTSFTTGNSNAKTIYIPIKANTTYTVSKTAGQRFWLATSPVVPTNNALYTDRQVNNTASSISLTSGANDRYLWAWVYLGGTDTGTLEDMLASVQIEFGSSASTFEAYSGESKTAYLHKVIFGGEVDVIQGKVDEYYPLYEIKSFNGMFGAVNNGYCFYIQVDDTEHTLTEVDANCMIANQLFTYGTVSRSSAPVWQYGGNDGTTKTHAFILPSEYDTLEKANNFLKSLETPLRVTLKRTTPNTFTFLPISMETDEGDNTLFATEGASALIYRKES